jgi:quinol monooxygenase YgiN
MSNDRVEKGELRSIHLCAIIRAQQGMESLLKAALLKVVAKTQSEPGCLLFQIHEFEDDPSQFMLWECFKDKISFEAHMVMPHTREYFARAKDLMSHPTQVVELKKLL